MAQYYPFKHVYTGIDKTVKRAVTLKTIRRIKELDLSLKPNLDFARDMFLFSFYTRGMSFIDMAYLKNTDFLPPPENQAADVHPMGKLYAGNSRQAPGERNGLLAADYQDTGQGTVAVPEHAASCQQQAEGNLDHGRLADEPYHVCEPPLMDEHSLEPEHSSVRHQRGHGA